jgi:hypothetical protein
LKFTGVLVPFPLGCTPDVVVFQSIGELFIFPLLFIILAVILYEDESVCATNEALNILIPVDIGLKNLDLLYAN